MSKDLDESLRSALRPVDPGEAFTRNVMAAIAQESPPGTSLRLQSARLDSAPAKPRTAFRWASAALVISLGLAVVIGHQWQAQREERGLQARRQLIQALQLTGEKLDVAYRAVNDVERTEPAP
jgi:negative regulator of sigma E activity